MLGNYTSSVQSEEQREFIIELISFLQTKKKYKQETFHIAVSIVDRYSIALKRANRETPCGALMATAAILMAAKLEQSVSPSFNRMINTLPASVANKVTKAALI